MEDSKRHYSYFIVKPDGIRYLDDICRTVEDKFPTVRYYAIEDFKGTIKKLYHKHYERKGSKFAESFDAFLYGLGELFGNETILILVADNQRPYQDLMQSVFDTKQELRNKYVNNKIGIVTNYGQSRSNFIRLLTRNGNEKKPRIMSEAGSYRISDMNTIHSPDPDLATTLDELKILLDSGVIHDKNLIKEDMLDKMRRYRTVAFQADMRLPNYAGEEIPNLSGFVRNEIFGEEENVEHTENVAKSRTEKDDLEL